MSLPLDELSVVEFPLAKGNEDMHKGLPDLKGLEDFLMENDEYIVKTEGPIHEDIESAIRKSLDTERAVSSEVGLFECLYANGNMTNGTIERI